MIFLLRQLRRIFLEKNKLKTYLVYAVGEIFLVVIGILIAVQIDNWNEERKINKSVKEHLSILKENLLEDKEQLANLTKTMSDIKICSDSLILQIMRIAPVDDNTTMYLVKLLLEYQFRPNKNALETITQAGEIPYMKPELQKAILDYYALIETTREREQISNNQIQGKYEVYINNVYPEVFQKTNKWTVFQEYYRQDPREPDLLDQSKLLSDKKLEALVISRHYQTTELQKYYSELSNQCELLLNNIEDHINMSK